MIGGRRRAATKGLVAGFVAALAMVLLSVLLRLFLGIPLLVELASDRIIPTLSIHRFVRLATRLGGLTRGKELALLGSFALQVAIATLAGLGAALILTSHERRRARMLVLGAVLALAAVGTALFLWPVLESNYRGLTPGAARVTNLVAVLASFAVYGGLFAAVQHGFRVASRAEDRDSPGGPRIGRRELLIGGGAFGLAVLSGGLIDVLFRRATVGPSGYDGLGVSGPVTDPITPNDRFYVVTKNLIDPVVNRSLWRLEVSGRVEEPHTFTWSEVASLPSVTQTQTLECISNPVGGGLMSNASWRGVPVMTLLAKVRPGPKARFVLFHAADGYTHGIALDRALDPSTVLAYEMNGTPLPPRHGYPARILVPGTYGEVNVKWIDRIELADRPLQGYYERQGWRPGFVNTTSRVDRPGNGESISLSAQPRIRVNGVAYAGNRGISKVEVSTDGGATWMVTGIDYAASRLSWALWSTTWTPPAPGRYVLVVRATDGMGVVQSSVRRGVAPSGAAGYQQIQVTLTP